MSNMYRLCLFVVLVAILGLTPVFAADPVTRLDRSFLVPWVTTEMGWDSAFALANPSLAPVHVTIYVNSMDGKPAQVVWSCQIPPGGVQTTTLSEMSRPWLSSQEHLSGTALILADGPLTGVELFMDSWRCVGIPFEIK